MLDAEVGPPYDGIQACRVDGSGVTWWGQRGREVFRIQRQLDPAPAA